MAKINKPEVKPTVSNVKSATSTSSFSSSTMKNSKDNSLFMFGKMNYILMTVGLILIAFGFVLMSGGATTDPAVFPKEEIYSARRITIAPMVVLLGFCIEIVAIFYKSSSDSNHTAAS
ncbi:MAG: DUF3098 domain-containing protein [Bacteroidota bacterium]